MMAFERGPARVTGLGLFESTAIGLCSIDDGNGDGGSGAGGGAAFDGAAAALAGGGAAGGGSAGGGDGAAGGAGAGSSDGGAGGGAAAGADPEWLGQFSAEGADADNPSNRDWLKSKGFKTLDDVAKSYREAEKAIRNGGGQGLQVPDDKATPEQIAAYNKAIGVPEKPEGYEISLPDGVTEEDLDLPLLGGLKEQALKAGVPAKGFNALVQGVVQAQLDGLEKARTAENSSRDELFGEWGKDKDAKMADVQNAMRALELRPEHVAAIQRGFALQFGEPGSKFTLGLLQKLGAGMAEHSLMGGDTSQRRFGVTAEQAQAEIDKLVGDKEFNQKMIAKDPVAVARWNRLNEAIAADRERKARQA